MKPAHAKSDRVVEAVEVAADSVVAGAAVGTVVEAAVAVAVDLVEAAEVEAVAETAEIVAAAIDIDWVWL